MDGAWFCSASVTMRDGRDDVLHTAPAVKNTVTIVTTVTDFLFSRVNFAAHLKKSKGF